MTHENLVEIEKIRQLKARYFRSMDQKNWEEWEQVFCEDATFDFTQEGPSAAEAPPVVKGRAVFRDYLPPILEGVKTVHHGHMSEIDITSASTASGIWSMEDMLWYPESKGGAHLWGMGWYYEKYRKDTDGQWRILEIALRRIRVEVNGVQTFPRE
jgi:hypothetical protein